MTLKGKCAIAGLGVTTMGRTYGRNAQDFAMEAVKLAIEDAGIKKDDIDGLLIQPGVGLPALGLNLQNSLRMRDSKLLTVMDAAGSTASQMVQYASQMIDAGVANVVACVYADAPLKPSNSAGAAFALRNVRPGMSGLYATYGYYGANSGYAMACQRHMHRYGTTSRQLGTIAVAERAWAAMNPAAQMRTPITIEDHQNSRYVIEPLHLLDCTLVSNGGVAVIVTSAERARSLRQPPVYVLGMGQGHPGDDARADWEPGIRTGAVVAKEAAFKMAGVSLDDIDIRELYDCYTYTVMVTLEDYGYCGKGEGGAFVADGKLGPGGSLPTNTGGGQLSGWYMMGMTPLAEAVVQTRGQGGERQVPKHDLVLVSGNGGVLAHHSTLILGSQPS